MFSDFKSSRSKICPAMFRTKSPEVTQTGTTVDLLTRKNNIGGPHVRYTSFNTTEAYNFQPPMWIFDSAASARQWRWCWDQSLACCAPLGRPKFSWAIQEQSGPQCSARRTFRWVEGMNDLHLQPVEWLCFAGSGAGVSGSTDSENEVMALGLQRSPTTLLGLEAPSHLCAVWPSGRQLLPLIISPNGWICFPLTSSSLHNNSPPWLHPDTPSSKYRPPFLPRLRVQQTQLDQQWKKDSTRLQTRNYTSLLNMYLLNT